MNPKTAYKLLKLMVDDLNDMCNNYDISEFETDSFKQTVLDEIKVFNEHNDAWDLRLIKYKDKYKLKVK